jgi:hypothetical protein
MTTNYLPPINPLYVGPNALRQDVFTTDTGEIIVRWPSSLTEEDYAFIDVWFDMLKRKMKRAVKAPASDVVPAAVQIDKGLDETAAVRQAADERVQHG